MTKLIVTFTGDPQSQPGRKRGGPADPETITAYGLTFELGEPVALEFSTPGAERILAKLRGNSHFTIEEPSADGAPKSKAKGRGKSKPADEDEDTPVE